MKRGFETTDINVGWVFIAALGLIIFGVILNLFLKPYFNYFTKGTTSETVEKFNPSGPKLQVDESRDLKTYLAKERLRLSTYDWIDKTKGIARIPIDRAIDILTHEKAEKK
jgi:hypothetical protein